VIKIVEHDTSVETKVMGLDHLPYSCNFTGVPDAISLAVLGGFAFNIPEFDCRATEWEPHAHSHRND